MNNALSGKLIKWSKNSPLWPRLLFQLVQMSQLVWVALKLSQKMSLKLCLSVNLFLLRKMILH